MKQNFQSPESGAQLWAALLKLPINELIKPEDEYEKIYQHRVARLKLMASKASQPEPFLKALDLTEKAHAIGKNLGASVKRIVPLVFLTTEDKLHRLFRSFDRVAASIPGIAPDMMADLAKSRAKVREKMLKHAKELPSPSEEQQVLKRTLDERTGDETEDHTLSLTVINTKHGLDSINGGVMVLGLFAQLAIIYRGVLYSGIMEKEGGKLKKDAQAAKAKDTAEEVFAAVFGMLPVIGSSIGAAITVFKIAGTWQADKELELLDAANKVMDYVTAYSELLTLWISIANSLPNSIDTAFGANDYFAND